VDEEYILKVQLDSPQRHKHSSLERGSWYCLVQLLCFGTTYYLFCFDIQQRLKMKDIGLGFTKSLECK
jgi:hypothetical protein